MDQLEQVVGLLTEIRDLLAHQTQPVPPNDGTTTVTGD